ncbi:MAG: glucosidase, partial [Acidobacteria bacterium]|nr:glucosidase [Acidobacteriota bacterium]
MMSDKQPPESNSSLITAEERRLQDSREHVAYWKRWGPYLSERAWGTVREDYSADGSAWEYFPHDHARSRAYRWNEDGIAGICDRHQQICFALALWNGRDPILKERVFGLGGTEGNHGEDVKEYYFYLDSTPTHSYMKYLYKYPQAAFPYEKLIEENRPQDKDKTEYELLDTGVFDEDRYFDVFVEYAKADVEDILIRITVVNRGSEAAELHLLPTIWFRNRWSWGYGVPRPELRQMVKQGDDESDFALIELEHESLGRRLLYCEGAPELLFTENETNNFKLFGVANEQPFVKDAFHEYVIHGSREAVNSEQRGTKAAAHYDLTVNPGETISVRLRFASAQETPDSADAFGAGFDQV